MTRLRAFAAFFYDFVIGDDPLIALAIVVALAITALVAANGVAAWWILPAAVMAALSASLARATRS